MIIYTFFECTDAPVPGPVPLSAASADDDDDTHNNCATAFYLNKLWYMHRSVDGLTSGWRWAHVGWDFQLKAMAKTKPNVNANESKMQPCQRQQQQRVRW